MNQSEKALANTILTKNQVWRSEDDLKLAEKQLVRSKTIKVLDELLAFTDDIQKSYIDADNELKRRYLQIFFEKIIVNDGQIVDVIYTPAISQLLEIDRVRITNNWRDTWVWNQYLVILTSLITCDKFINNLYFSLNEKPFLKTF